MSEQHTPGRLKNVKHSIYSDAGYSIALTLLTRSSLGEEHDEANARRLVACWNACEGIDTEHLENIDMLGETLAVRFAAFHASERELMDTRDKLLAAAQTTLAKNLHLADGDNCTLIDLKRAVERITGVEA